MYLFIYGWAGSSWLRVGFFLVVVSGGYSLRWVGATCYGTWALERVGSVVVTHGLSYSVPCGLFPEQGSNPCSLHCQEDSQPLDHWGSPKRVELTSNTSITVVQTWQSSVGSHCPQIPSWPNCFSPGSIPQGNENRYWRKNLFVKGHSSTVYNSKDVEITQMSISWRMNENCHMFTQWNIIQP